MTEERTKAFAVRIAVAALLATTVLCKWAYDAGQNMPQGNGWTAVAAVGQLFSAAATLVAIGVALWQAWRSDRAKRHEERQHRGMLLQAVRMELDENILLLKASDGNLYSFHRGAWESARSQLRTLDEDAVEALQSAYHFASRLNDLAEWSRRTGSGIPDSAYNNLKPKAQTAFEKAIGALSRS